MSSAMYGVLSSSEVPGLVAWYSRAEIDSSTTASFMHR
jgi:hypothetical protein